MRVGTPFHGKVHPDRHQHGSEDESRITDTKEHDSPDEKRYRAIFLNNMDAQERPMFRFHPEVPVATIQIIGGHEAAWLYQFWHMSEILQVNPAMEKIRIEAPRAIHHQPLLLAEDR